MAEESLTDKFWKLASNSAYDWLGLAPTTYTNQDNTVESKQAEVAVANPSAKATIASEVWPDFVCSDGKPWGAYAEADSSVFDVRGKNYLVDRVKRKSASSLFKLADLEIYECGVADSYHIASHRQSWYAKHHTQMASDTFFLIYSMQLSSLNIAVVATFIMKTNQPPSPQQQKQQPLSTRSTDEQKLAKDSKPKQTQPKQPQQQQSTETTETIAEMKADSATQQPKIQFTEADIESIPNIEQKVQHKDFKQNVDDANLWCPQLGYAPYDSRIWSRFLRGDELFINERLKVIPRIVEGSWYFTFPQRPALLGMKTPQRCYRGPNYLEIDCEADQSMIAAQITKAAWHISTYLVVDIVLTIEGRTKAELPERSIGGFQIRYVDPSKAQKLNSQQQAEEEENGIMDTLNVHTLINEYENDKRQYDSDDLENLE